jgi:hypothetical protein
MLAALLGAATACSSPNSTPEPPASPSGSATPSQAPPLSGITFPLTGLPADANLANADRPALAIKIDNVAAARPQAGLNDADVVIETPVEGGLTRLFAVFQSHDADLVGPIRSARPVDADLLRLFGHPYFVFSGGTPSDVQPVQKKGGAAALIWWDRSPAYFVTRADRKRPHHVFAHTSTLYAEGKVRAESGSTKATPPPPLPFDDRAPAGTPAHQIDLTFPSASAGWTWNGSEYLRTQAGTPDTLIDGAQVSAANVVVLSVVIKQTAAHDVHGTNVPLPDVVTSGKAWVYRDGVQVTGNWKRVKDQLIVTDDAGQAVTLKPGRSWVELLPTGRTPKIG